MSVAGVAILGLRVGGCVGDDLRRFVVAEDGLGESFVWYVSKMESSCWSSGRGVVFRDVAVARGALVMSGSNGSWVATGVRYFTQQFRVVKRLGVDIIRRLASLCRNWRMRCGRCVDGVVRWISFVFV